MKKDEIKKAAKQSFKTWYTIVGLIIAGTSLFNFIRNIWGFSIVRIVKVIIYGYESVFHTIVDTIFFWLPYELSPKLKDAIIVWSILIGSLIRIHWAYTGYMQNYYSKDKKGEKSISSFWHDRFGLIKFYSSLIIWKWLPFLYFTFKSPYVHHLMGARIEMLDKKYGKKETGHGGVLYLFDCRIMLAIQLISIISIALILISFNAFLSTKIIE